MLKVSDLWPSQFVSGQEIHDRPEEYADVTIRRIHKELIKNPEGKEKRQALFDVDGFDRPVIICKTAGKVIQGLYGDNPNEWIGKRIRLIPEWGKWFGKEQYAVRVANLKPAASEKGKPDKTADLERARKMALELVQGSPALDAWYEGARSGEGISQQDLANLVIRDIKRLGLTLSCTAADLLARLDPADEPATAPREAGAEG